MNARTFTIIHLVLLLVTAGFGASLLNNRNSDTQSIHGILGAFTGLAAAGALLLQYKNKKRGEWFLVLSGLSALFTLLASIGGHIAAKNYDTGVMLMRSSATLAIIFDGVLLYRMFKKPKAAK